MADEDLPVDSFAHALHHLNSDDFDGDLKILHDCNLTDAMAQVLGLALLRKKDQIQYLFLPIGSLSQAASTAYPALLEYFETTMPSFLVYFCGALNDDSNTISVTAHEVLNVFLSVMVKQNRATMPMISIGFVCLSRTSLDFLEAFPVISFGCCDITNRNDNDRPMTTSIQSFQQHKDRRCEYVFGPGLSTNLMSAAKDLFSNPHRDLGFYFYQLIGKEKIHEHLNFAMDLIKSQKTATEKERHVTFLNLDTDGSRVVQTMLGLSPHAASLPMALKFVWSDGSDKDPYDVAAIQRRAQSIFETMCQCRFVDLDVDIEEGGSIFNAQQLDAMKQVSNLNIQIPRLIDSKTEEFWMNNLGLIQHLLHPKRLAHPRFRDVYFRFLRNNFNVFQSIMSWYKGPPLGTSGRASQTRRRRASTLKSTRNSAPNHDANDGPAFRTRRRVRSDTISCSTGSTAPASKPGKRRKL